MYNFICAIIMLTFGVSGQHFHAAYQVPMSAAATSNANQHQALKQLQQHVSEVNIADRQQRSLYGGTWNKHDLGIAPIGVGHITKAELIALLDAWTEVESGLKPKPAEETVPDMVAESQEDEENGIDQDEKVVEENVEIEKEEEEVGGAAAVQQPLTVSLPAFVPIQLTATYTAPTQASAAAIIANAALGAGGAIEHTKSLSSLFKLTTRSSLPPRPTKPAPIPKPQVFNAFKPKVKNIPSISIKPAQTSLLRSALPHKPLPTRIVAPPPPFLAHPPAPLELVPSAQLWSYWH